MSDSNNSNTNSSPFSVDLVENSKLHISFLSGLHSLGVTNVLYEIPRAVSGLLVALAVSSSMQWKW
jgi:hypothetical protein